MERATSISALRVMQWNILADGLAQFGDFVRVPKEVLDWSTRAPKVLAKILEAAADVVCLEELNHYGDYFLPQLQQHGYSGVFRPKKFSPAVKYGFPPDGCAVFFRASRLLLVERRECERGERVMLMLLCLMKRTMTNFLPRAIGAEQEVQMKHGIICCLKDCQTNQELVLATTHLKAKAGKENEDIRLKQIQELVQNLVTCTRHGAVPSVICGDFNTNPHSIVYKLLHEHSLGLQSVYACGHELLSEDNETTSVIQLVKSTDGGAAAEPPFTTWKFRSTGEKQETIDYIWFSRCPRLIPDRLWRLPSATSIGVDGLPSEAMPSDHLPLLCEFVWNQEAFHDSVLL